MTKIAHTPGPWNRNIPPASKYSVIFARRNTLVAKVISGGLTAEEIEANANLIAAAPALLEALQELVDIIDGALEDDGVRLALKGHMDGLTNQPAQAAISLALGREL